MWAEACARQMVPLKNIAQCPPRLLCSTQWQNVASQKAQIHWQSVTLQNGQLAFWRLALTSKSSTRVVYMVTNRDTVYVQAHAQ